MVSQEIIRATVAAYMAANNALDVEGFVNVFADDAVLYNVVETSPIRGKEAVRRVAEQTLLPFSETNVKVERLYIVENGAAIFYSGYLTTKNGRTANVDGIDVFEINEEGKIQAIRYYLDPATVVALFSDEAL